MQNVETKSAQLPLVQEARNDGIPLDLDWVASAQANTSAIERRAKTLPGRRSVKKEFQAAWLCKAISCIDLTTLSGDDSEGRVFLHRGIAARQFQRSYVLADGVEVGDATMENGLLHVDLTRARPETVVQTINIKKG